MEIQNPFLLPLKWLQQLNNIFLQRNTNSKICDFFKKMMEITKKLNSQKFPNSSKTLNSCPFGYSQNFDS
jgi:hypothetical protein